ncbi:MAG: DMT family transporter [Saccharofermentanales bacterium]
MYNWFFRSLFRALTAFNFILATKGIDGLRISQRGLFYTIILGIFTKAFFKMSYNSSIKYAGVTTSAVLVTTATIWVAVMSVMFFKEKFYSNKYVAILVNIVGVIMIVTLGDLAAINANLFGIFLGLLAAFLNACATIITKLAAAEDDPITMTFYMLLQVSRVQ